MSLIDSRTEIWRNVEHEIERETARKRDDLNEQLPWFDCMGS